MLSVMQETGPISRPNGKFNTEN